MRICVLSDIHYKYSPQGSEDERRAAAILSFLREAVGKYGLMVLNGDIFDLWFDWKYALVKQYFPLLHRLAALVDSGCRLVLVSGNHDFWFGDFLSRYLGVEMHCTHYKLSADGNKYLFTHGDLHTVNDLRYKLLRRFLRLPGVKGCFALLHPDFALWLGGLMSRSSRLRRVSHSLQSRKGQGLVQYAQAQISKYGYDAVFMGHSHRPAISELRGGKYVNSGDWIEHQSYVEITDGIIELKEYTR